MAALIRGAAALLLIGLSACEPEPTALRFDDDALVVQSVLVAGESLATVFVARMRPAMPNGGYAAVGATDARVRLAAAGDTIELLHGVGAASCRTTWGAPDSNAGCYTAAVAGGVRPGVTYHLLVQLPGRELVHGSTVVPHEPAVLTPAAGTVLTTPRSQQDPRPPPVSVTWSVDPESRHTELRVAPEDAECVAVLRDGEGWALHVIVTGASTAALALEAVACDAGAPPDRMQARIVLSLFDRNYTDYTAARSGSSVRRDEAAAGVAGAWGVFGSVASAHQPVELVAPQPSTIQ